MHLANLYGKRTIILWGPGSYERIHPIGGNNRILIREIDCRPCRQYITEDHCERGTNECLQRITVEDVIAEADRLLSKH